MANDNPEKSEKRAPMTSDLWDIKKTPSGRIVDDGIKRTPSGKPIQCMYVLNRKGEEEDISFDQILKRIQRLSYGLHELVDPARVTQGVINGMYSGIKTCELDEAAAQTCAYMATTHPDFSILAARITTDNLHKNTSDDIAEVANQLYNFKDMRGRDASLISKEVYDFILKHKDRLNKEIDYTRDFNYDYFGFKTLERSYLLRINNKIVERPQHMLMRVSIGIHIDDIDRALETYHLMSQKYFTHATPTLFNSGTPRPQMSSCFLLSIQSDSIEGIFETLKQCALISKTAGGVGIAVQDVRGQNSYIRGTNGISNGLIPMLRVFNDTARYVDQGGGKRKGSFAVYIEPWHSDIFEFLDLRKNHGKEELRARDLFYALWIPDLFMKRVKENKDWTLMCPNECPGLSETWGEEFEKLYTKYEEEGAGKRTVPAQDLWFAVLQSQIETGTPYMLYKDACNAKSNQKNLGTIKCSNLCCEIIEYTSPGEVAVCNLASVALSKYVDMEKKQFDFKKAYDITRIITRNLDKIIERNYYPVKEAKVSNHRHRPIGIGVQGLADTFMLLRYPYESDEAKELNKRIFETMYYAALEESVELAKVSGPYETFKGSPASKGILQFDMWNVKVDNKYWNWDELKQKIIKHGLRNSLLLAPMPTASTSQILGNNESFEPYTSNIYYRRVLSGEFFVVNPHALKDLFDRGLWDEDMKQQAIAHNGSIQYINEIPDDLKALYKTVWEIKQKNIIDMAADRGAFVDQSQSLNIHIQKPTFAKLSSMHFYGWEKGLKTGAYYLRTQAATDAIKFTVDTHVLKTAAKLKSGATGEGPKITREVSRETVSTSATAATVVCPLRRNNDEECLMCSG